MKIAELDTHSWPRFRNLRAQLQSANSCAHFLHIILDADCVLLVLGLESYCIYMEPGQKHIHMCCVAVVNKYLLPRRMQRERFHFTTI